MLIKSECQPLDKTRHKLAHNLFEQREPCKMAGEICSAACPLGSTHAALLSRLSTTRPERATAERQIGGDVEESTQAHLFCSLSG